MTGILADAQIIGDVEKLVAAMQRDPWTELWDHLGLTLYRFEDLGLTTASTDMDIWLRCQAEKLVLITDNRNEDSRDSLETAIKTHHTPSSLPVFTISKLRRFQKGRTYADRVLRKLYDYLLDIERVRGAGRVYLP